MTEKVLLPVFLEKELQKKLIKDTPKGMTVSQYVRQIIHTYYEDAKNKILNLT